MILTKQAGDCVCRSGRQPDPARTRYDALLFGCELNEDGPLSAMDYVNLALTPLRYPFLRQILSRLAAMHPASLLDGQQQDGPCKCTCPHVFQSFQGACAHADMLEVLSYKHDLHLPFHTPAWTLQQS